MPTRPPAGLRPHSPARPTPTPAHTHTPSPTALPPAVSLTGLNDVWRDMEQLRPGHPRDELSYFGSRTTQAEIAATLLAV